MQSVKDNFRWAVTYLFGVLLALFFFFGLIFGLIKLKGWKKLRSCGGGVLLAPNHPSLLDPFLMIALFCADYLRYPVRLGPSTLADMDNYAQHIGWRTFRDNILPVVRPEKNCQDKEILRWASEVNKKTANRTSEILASGGNVICFFERGRTWRGEGKGEKFIRSPKGNRMIVFEDGAGLIAKRSGANVVPVWIWIHWFWKIPTKIRISIGDPMKFDRKEKTEEVTRKIQNAILELSDES